MSRALGTMKWQAAYAVLVAGVLLAGMSRWAYDDPFITYRYAENIRHGLGFVYNPGQRVLSTTTPLLALLLAALSVFWGNLPQLAHLVGAASVAAGALCLWQLGRAWETPAAGWAALLLYPTFPLLLTTFGSEMPLHLALCLGAFAAYARGRYVLAALCAGLAVLTRGDGAIVAGLLALHFLAVERRTGAAVPWRAAAVFAAIVLAWTVFATGYFGSPIPVTLAAKQRQGAMIISQSFAAGFVTTFRPMIARWYVWPMLGLAAVGLVFAWRSARRWLLFLLWPVLYFVGYSALGVSRYPWYYAPLAPGFVALIGLGAEAVARWLRADAQAQRRPGWRASATAALLVLAGAQGWTAAGFFGRSDQRAAIYRAVGEWLAANTPADASVGALEVGIIGYYAQRPMVDFAGLLQPDIAAQLTPTTTYEDSTRWGIARYHPAYLVLNPVDFGPMIAEELRPNCQPAREFDGAEYGYPGRLAVLACEW